MDSATTYLFNHDVQSLAAVLPYPPTLKGLTPDHGTHASDAFCHAFAHGQQLVVDRTMKGTNWPLFEFWTDSVQTQRDNLGSYIDPILSRALERKKAKKAGKNDEEVALEKDKDGKQWASMLEYLVDMTDGDFDWVSRVISCLTLRL